MHVRGGQFYRWAVRGWVHVGDHNGVEARQLLDLRYRLSAAVADEYAAAGFTTIVQDNIYGIDVERWLESVRAQPKHLVVLRPSVEVVEPRDAERQHRLGRIPHRDEYTPAINDKHVASTRRDLGLWLDTSDRAGKLHALRGRRAHVRRQPGAGYVRAIGAPTDFPTPANQGTDQGL